MNKKQRSVKFIVEGLQELTVSREEGDFNYENELLALELEQLAMDEENMRNLPDFTYYADDYVPYDDNPYPEDSEGYLEWKYDAYGDN